jgi:F-type H+-transporting ATPase subunit beta
LPTETWVDDVVQEAFVEAFNNLSALRQPMAFGAWLRLIVRKHADRIVRRAPPRWSPFAVGAAELDPQVIVEERELAQVVRDALASATDSDRLLLGLRYYGGWTEPEMAKAFNTTPSAIKKRLHDARRRLRPALMDHPLVGKELAVTARFDPRPLLGRQITPGGQPLDEGPAVVLPGQGPAVSRRPAEAMLPTGIKVLDVFCPLLRGGSVELLGPEGCGQLVLVAELADRLSATGTVTIAAGRDTHPYGVGTFSNWRTDLDALDARRERIPGTVANTVGILSEDTERGWTDAVTSAAAISEAFVTAGSDVLLVIEAKDVLQDHPQLAAIRDLAGLRNGAAVTVVIARPDSGPDQLSDVDPRYDTSVMFSRAMVARGWYPAIHPLASRSRWAEQLDSADRHRLIATEAALIIDRAERARLYLTQPFAVAEAFTGKPGIGVKLDAALDDIEAILDGATAGTPAEQLAYVGSINRT